MGRRSILNRSCLTNCQLSLNRVWFPTAVRDFGPHPLPTVAGTRSVLRYSWPLASKRQTSASPLLHPGSRSQPCFLLTGWLQRALPVSVCKEMGKGCRSAACLSLSLSLSARTLVLMRKEFSPRTWYLCCHFPAHFNIPLVCGGFWLKEETRRGLLCPDRSRKLKRDEQEMSEETPVQMGDVNCPFWLCLLDSWEAAEGQTFVNVNLLMLKISHCL